MALNLGSTAISSLRLGTATPSKLMLGDVQVWPAVATGPELWTPADAPETIIWVDPSDASLFTVGAGNAIQNIQNKIKTPPSKAAIYMQQENATYQPILENNAIVSDRKFLYDKTSWTRVTDGSIKYGWILAVDTATGQADKYGRLLTYDWQTDAGLDPIRDGSTVEIMYAGSDGGMSPAGTCCKWWSAAGSVVPVNNQAGMFDVISSKHQNLSAQLYVNGTAGTPAAPDSVLQPNQPWGQGFSLGGHLSTANASTNGVFRDLVFYDSTGDSSGALHDKLVGWMAWKVGSQALLPADHPYKSAPPTKPAP